MTAYEMAIQMTEEQPKADIGEQPESIVKLTFSTSLRDG